MKIIIIIIMIVGLVQADPTWYRSLDRDFTTFGYGQDHTRTKALAKAKADLSEQFSLRVRSSMYSHENANGSSHSNKITSSSNFVFTGVKVTRIECANDSCYAAVEYSTASLARKMFNKLDSRIKVSPTYLNKTPFGQELNNFIGYDISLKLIQKDENWYITHGNVSIYVPKKELVQFMLDKNNISMNHILRHHDRVNFSWDRNFEYQTLISVDYQGRIGIVENTISTDHYPDNGHYIQAEAEYKTIYEMVILIESPQPIELRFEELGEKVLDDDNLLLDDLIDILDQYDYKSTVYKIKGLL